jgi:hypothetical protein
MKLKMMLMVYIAKGEGRVQKANYKGKSKDCLRGCA